MTAKDYIDVDSVRFHKETPSTDVKKDALFYAYFRPALDGAFKLKYDREWTNLSAQRPGWNAGSSYRVPVELPPELDPWHMELITCTPAAMEPLLSDFSIDGAYADWVPDIWASYHALNVTASARHVIEKLDPGFNYFYPMTIREIGTGDPLPGERFHWVPRRRLFVPYQRDADLTQGQFAVWEGGRFSNMKYVWQYNHNQDLRAFLADLPFWAEGFSTFSFAMSRPAFRQLKSKAFTGLLELECEDRYDDRCDRSHNVGHF